MEKHPKTGPRKFNKESQEKYLNNKFWDNCKEKKEKLQ